MHRVHRGRSPQRRQGTSSGADRASDRAPLGGPRPGAPTLSRETARSAIDSRLHKARQLGHLVTGPGVEGIGPQPGPVLPALTPASVSIQRADLESGDPVPTLPGVKAARFTWKAAKAGIANIDSYETQAAAQAFGLIIGQIIQNNPPDLDNNPPVTQADFIWGTLNGALATAPDSWHALGQAVALKIWQYYNTYQVTVGPWWASADLAEAAVLAVADPLIQQTRALRITALANAYQGNVAPELEAALRGMDPTRPLDADNAAEHYLANLATNNLAVPTQLERQAWTLDLKQMPTIDSLIKGTLFQATDPTEVELGEIGGTDVNWVFPHPGTVKWFDNVQDTDGEDVPLNHPIQQRLSDAWERIKKLVDPAVLNTLGPPGVRVVNQTSSKFRAFYRNRTHTIHIARDESVHVIVHEFGHHLEGSLASDLWLGLQRLLRTRTTGGPTLAGIGFKLFGKAEGRYRATMPATGEYSARAYSWGDTEVMSMSMEHLSQPGKAKALVEKDPQQAAIVLRKILPTEYTNACGNTYDQFLP